MEKIDSDNVINNFIEDILQNGRKPTKKEKEKSLNKEWIVAIIVIIIIIVVCIAYASTIGNPKKFVITNKTNAEIEVSIWVYDGCVYNEHKWNDPNDAFYTTYVDPGSTVTIMRTDDIECATAHIFSSGFSQYKYIDDRDLSIFSGGLELIFHQDGTYDYND